MALANGFRVNTNTTSFHTYRSYSHSQAGLEQNIERLSSGLRINQSADDTAGQAISQRMKNQTTGMRQAVQNSQQANNYLQTAEGSLNQIHGILTRMRELAVQSASDNLNANDRNSIDLEYSQLKQEIDRIAQSTTYNQMGLINGERAKGVEGTALNHGVGMFEAPSVASNVETGHQFQFIDITFNSLTLRNINTGDEQTLQQPNQDFAPGDELNFDQLGIKLVASESFDTHADSIVNDSGFGGLGTMTLNSQKLFVNQGHFATMQVGTNNDASHASSDSSDPNDPAATSSENRITLNISDASTKGLGLSSSGVESLGDSQRSINAIDSAIKKINDERGNIGALQNRFEFAVSNLQSGIQNTESSQSTILDADFALEAAGMAKNQILTQSGTAMLAQANQISQNILSLLK